MSLDPNPDTRQKLIAGRIHGLTIEGKSVREAAAQVVKEYGPLTPEDNFQLALMMLREQDIKSEAARISETVRQTKEG